MADIVRKANGSTETGAETPYFSLLSARNGFFSLAWREKGAPFQFLTEEDQSGDGELTGRIISLVGDITDPMRRRTLWVL